MLFTKHLAILCALIFAALVFAAPIAQSVELEAGSSTPTPASPHSGMKAFCTLTPSTSRPSLPITFWKQPSGLSTPSSASPIPGTPPILSPLLSEIILVDMRPHNRENIVLRANLMDRVLQSDPSILIDFLRNGCPNCEELMQGSSDRIRACTTIYFDGIIANIDPERSWVSRWQRTCT
ncbi:hypothetical protein K488DRAFT_86686 [Vararia minispora EC-137]|uniref:Uncharacterized protein n=1 Tax=Vararia minispora EC-137 TaxID=1314806 RepID=A0ACB8QIV4_9AGAM|nr:hypothetical protein K488DRAFT_86686 [Vararia minispora EC-137]